MQCCVKNSHTCKNGYGYKYIPVLVLVQKKVFLKVLVIVPVRFFNFLKVPVLVLVHQKVTGIHL